MKKNLTELIHKNTAEDYRVMTCAVAEAVMNGGKRKDFIEAMKKYGRMYPNAGYGLGFIQTAQTRTTALETALPCGYPPAAGVWTVALLPEQACGPAMPEKLPDCLPK